MAENMLSVGLDVKQNIGEKFGERQEKWQKGGESGWRMKVKKDEGERQNWRTTERGCGGSFTSFKSSPQSSFHPMASPTNYTHTLPKVCFDSNH